MFTGVVGSLLWKEYRVQRALWLFLCALVLVLQILLRLAFFTTHGADSAGSSSDEIWATWAMWFVTFAAQVGFVFASAAIAFAGEREERTSDWLVQLSPPPGAVLLVKMGTCLGGCLALYLCGALVTLLIGRSASGQAHANYIIMLSHQSFGVNFAVRAVLIVSLLVWCTFGSLLSQRVLVSIPMMALGFVVTCWIPLAILGMAMQLLPAELVPLTADGSISLVGYLVIVLAMLAVDFWLGYRWVQGQFFDFQFLGDYRDSWSGAWFEVRSRSEQPSRIPRGIELEEGERRSWQRLVWQERYRGVLVRWMTIAVGVLAVFLTLCARGREISRREFGVPTGQDVVVSLLALVMGVLAFRSDGEGQPIRFLANHGTSPGMLWKAKQFVWMTRAFLTSVVLLCLFAPASRELYDDLFQQKERYLWLILISYGCGQLAAMLLHRAILAAVAGATAAGILFYWLELMSSLNMPTWWSLGIPALAPLLATWINIRAWLMEESTRLQKMRLTAVLVGLPLVTCSIVATFRAFEVNSKAATWESGPVFQNRYQWMFDHEAGNLTNAAAHPTKAPPVRLMAIADTLERGGSVKYGATTVNLDERQQKMADEVAAYFNAFSAVIHGPLDQPDHLFPVDRFDKLSELLRARAEGHLRANEPKQALEICLAHLNACRALARGPFNPCWQAGAERERRSLDLLVEWANHPAVSPGEIHGVIKDLEGRLQQFPTPSSAIIDELWEARRGAIVEQYARLHGTTHGWEWIWLQLPWEVSRRQQLWEREAMLHRANLGYRANRLSLGPELPNGGDMGVSVDGDYLAVAAELQATTWGAEVALAHDRTVFVRDRFTVAKATLTRLGIIAYRKQHGKMPADLDALFGIVRQSNLLDPWSSGRFEYRTTGLISQGTNQGATTVAAQVTGGVAGQSLVASRFVFPIPPAPADQNVEPSAPADQGRGR